jgi:dTDP-4-amino-4,6-dideoxygalactose transaminase
MKIPFLDLKAQYKEIESEVIPIVTQAMADGMFIGGSQVSGFEEEFAEFCDCNYCIGVGSGTDALRFALLAAGVGSGDVVVTVPNTFIATTEAISQVGATPVFVDIDPHTYNMDPQKLEQLLKEKYAQTTKAASLLDNPPIKAVLPVHLYGQPADMDPILEIAHHYDLVVIEDACQAHGATYKNRKVGSMGKAGCFSFYPGKNLGAFGEAGAVVTRDEGVAQKVRMLRDHGQARKYFHDFEGYNGRLDAIQAAVLRVKLNRLQDWNRSRRDHAALYKQLLQHIPGIVLPVESEFIESVHHLFVILADDRHRLQNFLAEKGISTGLHYPLPLHLQKAYMRLSHTKGDFPVAESAAERLLSLPMYPELTHQQIICVCNGIEEFIKGKDLIRGA